MDFARPETLSYTPKRWEFYSGREEHLCHLLHGPSVTHLTPPCVGGGDILKILEHFMRLVVLFLWELRSQERNYSQLCKTQFRSANTERLTIIQRQSSPLWAYGRWMLKCRSLKQKWREVKKVISTNARGCYVRSPAIEFGSRLLVLRLSTI